MLPPRSSVERGKGDAMRDVDKTAAIVLAAALKWREQCDDDKLTIKLIQATDDYEEAVWQNTCDVCERKDADMAKERLCTDCAALAKVRAAREKRLADLEYI